MKSNLLIHHNNVAYATDFTHQLLFKLPHGDIDKYITEIIIPQIKKIDFDVLYIKDSLSLNNLDFYGLRVAYHVRLSPELGKKKYIPIVILSELDGQVIRKITPMAKIIFTDNIFLEKNNKSVLLKFRDLDIKPLDEKMFVDGFLNQIDISAPQDYLSHHAITNEWAIEKWSQALGTHTKAIESNRNNISSMLYFKYLKSLHAENIFGEESYNVKKLQNTGKILYIDDEWNKGWSDVLKSLFSSSKRVEFNTFEYEYKDKNKFKIIGDIKAEILNKLPDVVLLDLRLSQSDHYEKNDLTQYTGMKIVEVIKDINPGIQIIMLTATSQSVILEKLYEAGILGYIKKEHPDDLSIKTTENISKLISLVEQGLEKSYLKKIWFLQNKLIKLKIIQNAEEERDNLNNSMNKNPINLEDFQKNRLSEESEKLLELKSTIGMLYEVLDSNIKKKFSFAVLNIFKCFEIIADYYIREESIKKNDKQIFKAVWKNNGEIISSSGNCSVNNKLTNVMNRVLIDIDEKTKQNKNKIVCTRNAIIHPDTISPTCENKVIEEINLNETHISNWFEMFCIILEGMDRHIRDKK